MSKSTKIIITISSVLSAIIIFGSIAYFVYDFIHDYECYTTSDLDWYNTHGCSKYERGH